jgi:hypothetical protein
MTDAERQEWDLKLRKLDSEIEHLRAETARNLREMRYPPVVIAALILGFAGPVAISMLAGAG